MHEYDNEISNVNTPGGCSVRNRADWGKLVIFCGTRRGTPKTIL